MRLSAKQVDNCYNEALLAFVYCRYQGMYLYLSHTNVIILLLHRCSEKLKNAYMRPYSMPGTYRKRIYMSLVHNDSFRQTLNAPTALKGIPLLFALSLCFVIFKCMIYLERMSRMQTCSSFSRFMKICGHERMSSGTRQRSS